MTGCGCLGVTAALVALLVIFIRGSFDSGEPIEQTVVLSAALFLALWAGWQSPPVVEWWQRKLPAHQLVCARRT